jgi:hypothetical protein
MRKRSNEEKLTLWKNPCGIAAAMGRITGRCLPSRAICPLQYVHLPLEYLCWHCINVYISKEMQVTACLGALHASSDYLCGLSWPRVASV